MDVLKIIGGKPLKGMVKAAGAKNAITKLLVASLFVLTNDAHFITFRISATSM